VVENLSLMSKNLNSDLVRYNSSIYKVLEIYTHQTVVVRPLISLKTGPHFKTRKRLEKKIMVIGPNGTRNYELLC
jgi:hypothetical protein